MNLKTLEDLKEYVQKLIDIKKTLTSTTSQESTDEHTCSIDENLSSISYNSDRLLLSE